MNRYILATTDAKGKVKNIHNGNAGGSCRMLVEADAQSEKFHGEEIRIRLRQTTMGKLRLEIIGLITEPLEVCTRMGNKTITLATLQPGMNPKEVEIHEQVGQVEILEEEDEEDNDDAHIAPMLEVPDFLRGDMAAPPRWAVQGERAIGRIR